MAAHLALQDTQDLAASDGGDLGNAVLITQQHTNLAWCHALLGHLADHLCDLANHKGKSQMTAKSNCCQWHQNVPVCRNMQWMKLLIFTISATHLPRRHQLLNQRCQ